MTVIMWVRFAIAATLFVVSANPPVAAEPPVAGASQPKGDLWEVTSQMSMDGMDLPMPAQKLKVCSPKEWTRPPAPANEDQKCVNSEFVIDGPKSTWKTTCENPPMTGTGEITRDGDAAYSGAIKFTSNQGNLTIKLDGHRVGDCDNPVR